MGGFWAAAMTVLDGLVPPAPPPVPVSSVGFGLKRRLTFDIQLSAVPARGSALFNRPSGPR
jgi:hypothetical protein